MTLDEECKDCLYNSQMKKVEKGRPDGAKFAEFKKEVRALCDNPPETYCAPLLMRDIDGLHRKIFGSGIDYSAEKKMFNSAVLNFCPHIPKRRPCCRGNTLRRRGKLHRFRQTFRPQRRQP